MKPETQGQTRKQARAAREAFLRLSVYPERGQLIRQAADALGDSARRILEANEKDLSLAADLSASLRARLRLDLPKLHSVIDGMKQIAAMPDPVGSVLEETALDDGLYLRKVRTPIGVIAAVFESRPDVVPQIASLCLKSANAVLLKGGKEAAETNAALADIFRKVLEPADLSDAVQLIPGREAVAELLEMDDLVSLVVPRGSNAMVRSIQQSTRIPVLGHADGICHVYLHEAADPAKSASIAVDAKVQYPAACNAVETLLVDSAFPHLEAVARKLHEAGVELRVCRETAERLRATGVPFRLAKDEDFGFEFSDKILAVKVVNGVDAAIRHIHDYGSSHTDCIVTEDAATARHFLDRVDSAGVYWNASTRFADGYRYGFGAEVGISTNRTHARGPVGIDGLLIYKYQLTGKGHVVSDYVGPNARLFRHERIASDDKT